MRIAIVDDMPILLEDLKKKLQTSCEKYPSTVEIIGFQSAKEFLESYEKQVFHVVFLDIYLPEINGLEIARILREKDENVLIIFCTSDDSMVYNSIKYGPFRYLRKSMLDKELDEAVEAIFLELKKLQYKIVVKTTDGMIPILAKEIIYLESKGHYINVHVNDNVFVFKGKINDYEVDLSHLGFIRTHIGFLVNLLYIYKIEACEVTLNNGKKLPISKHRVSDVRMKFRKMIKNIT